MANAVMASNKNKLQAREEVLGGFVRTIKSSQTLKEIILTNRHLSIICYPNGNTEPLDR